MAKMLMSSANVVPKGLALAVFDFEANRFKWIDLPELAYEVEGATAITKWGEYYYVLIEHRSKGLSSSLVVFDKNLTPVQSALLREVRDAHSMIEMEGGLLIASTGTDELIRCSLTETGAKEEIFWRYGRHRSDTVHINSLALYNGDVYVSMFGPKNDGKWEDRQDGSIVNIRTGDVIDNHLFHPHSLKNIDDKLFVLESRRGRVLELNPHGGEWTKRTIVELPGYVRGITRDGSNLYIAGSTLREKSKSTGEWIDPDKDRRLNYLAQTQIGSVECSLTRVSADGRIIDTRSLGTWGREVYDVEVVENDHFTVSNEDNHNSLVMRLSRYDIFAGELLRERDMIKQNQLSQQQSIVSYLQKLIADRQRLQEAAELIDVLLVASPENPVWNYLKGFTLHQLNTSPEDALRYYALSLEKGFDKFWVLYNRGCLLFSMGRLVEARSDLEQAAALRSDHEGASMMLKETNDKLKPEGI